MDIPKLMTEFASEDSASVVSTLIKTVPQKAADEKKEKLNLFLDLDLDRGCIAFTPFPFHEKDPQKYYYFGNNPAAARQIYLVRDVKSMTNFWLGRMKGIMMNLVELLQEGQLRTLLLQAAEEGLFDESGLCLEKLSAEYADRGQFSFDRESKSLFLSDGEKTEKLSFDKFFSTILEAGSGKKFILVVPRILSEGSEIVLSRHEDYIAAISKMMEGSGSGSAGICHICGKEGEDINTKEYSSKFDKSGLGKVFVTTTINYAPLFKKELHQRNFAICRNCYEKFLHGEKEVMRRFRLKVAREDCILLFEGLDRRIDPEYMEGLKQDIDAVFNLREIKDWSDKFVDEVERRQGAELYQFNMVFYRTDGKATAIKKTIENISSVRFQKVLKALEQGRLFVNEYLPQFTLGHIYHLVPIHKNKSGEQTNIKTLLNLYSDIIKGHQISRAYLFDTASDAFSKMINELRSSKIRNFENLISKKPTGGQATVWDIDINIGRLAMKYIAFIHSLEILGILDEEVFDLSEKVSLEQAQEQKEYLQVREAFLDKNGFSKAARGLFYLGALMYEIGRAQYKQGHKHKPVLDKLEYKGMNKNDVLEFYGDLMEKVRQYRRIFYSEKGAGQKCESFMKQAFAYIGHAEALDEISEKETVFYIMSGYAFSVNTAKYSAPSSGKDVRADFSEEGTEEDRGEGAFDIADID